MAPGGGRKGSGPASGVPDGTVVVYHHDAGKFVQVRRENLLRCIDFLGLPPLAEGSTGLLLCRSNGKTPEEMGVSSKVSILAGEPNAEKLWQMLDGPSIKHLFSDFPPLTPTEAGSYVQRLAFAQGGDEKAEIRADLQRRIERCRALGDSHSVRYLDILAQIIDRKALECDSLRERVVRESHLVSDGHNLLRQGVDALLRFELDALRQRWTQEVKSVEDRENRRIDLYTQRKDLSNMLSMVKFIVPSTAVLLGAYQTLQGFFSQLSPPSKWGILSGVAAGIGGFFYLVVRSINRRIQQASAAIESIHSQANSQIAQERKTLKDEARGAQDEISRSEQAALAGKGAEWRAFVLDSAVDAAVRAFDVCYEFFPLYANAELAQWGATPVDFEAALAFGSRVERLSRTGPHPAFPPADPGPEPDALREARRFHEQALVSDRALREAGLSAARAEFRRRLKLADLPPESAPAPG